jgi:Predicted ring-cleavage extradiol dioxygenase
MVKNLDKSIEFYQNIVGLTVNERFGAGPCTEIAFLGAAETKIELICNQNKQEIDPGKDISWGFETESLDGAIALLKENEIAFTGPFQPNPHVRFIYANDPDGMKIQFVQHL